MPRPPGAAAAPYSAAGDPAARRAGSRASRTRARAERRGFVVEMLENVEEAHRVPLPRGKRHVRGQAAGTAVETALPRRLEKRGISCDAHGRAKAAQGFQ